MQKKQNIAKDTLSKDHVAQSIINLHKYVTEYDEEGINETMRAFAKTYLVATIDCAWRKAEKQELEMKAKNIGISIFKKQKGLSDSLEAQKVQFIKEWKEHTAAIKKANSVLAAIKNRLEEIEQTIGKNREILRYYKDNKVPAAYIVALYKHQISLEESHLIFSKAIKQGKAQI